MQKQVKHQKLKFWIGVTEKNPSAANEKLFQFVKKIENGGKIMYCCFTYTNCSTCALSCVKVNSETSFPATDNFTFPILRLENFQYSSLTIEVLVYTISKFIVDNTYRA